MKAQVSDGNATGRVRRCVSLGRQRNGKNRTSAGEEIPMVIIIVIKYYYIVETGARSRIERDVQRG